MNTLGNDVYVPCMESVLSNAYNCIMSIKCLHVLCSCICSMASNINSPLSVVPDRRFS